MLRVDLQTAKLMPFNDHLPHSLKTSGVEWWGYAPTSPTVCAAPDTVWQETLVMFLIWRFGEFSIDRQIKILPIELNVHVPMAARIQIAK